MKNLREDGYILMDKDSLITLTDKGMAIARNIYDRHKALTAFLVRLGVDEATARERRLQNRARYFSRHLPGHLPRVAGNAVNALIRRENRRMMALFSRFLSEDPRGISREMARQVAECGVSRPHAMALLLAEACGVDSEKERDFFGRPITRPAIRECQPADYRQNFYLQRIAFPEARGRVRAGLPGWNTPHASCSWRATSGGMRKAGKSRPWAFSTMAFPIRRCFPATGCG